MNNNGDDGGGRNSKHLVDGAATYMEQQLAEATRRPYTVDKVMADYLYHRIIITAMEYMM